MLSKCRSYTIFVYNNIYTYDAMRYDSNCLKCESKSKSDAARSPSQSLYTRIQASIKYVQLFRLCLLCGWTWTLHVHVFPKHKTLTKLFFLLRFLIFGERTVCEGNVYVLSWIVWKHGASLTSTWESKLWNFVYVCVCVSLLLLFGFSQRCDRHHFYHFSLIVFIRFQFYLPTLNLFTFSSWFDSFFFFYFIHIALFVT